MEQIQTLTPGAPVEGGYHGGQILVNGQAFNIILPPKSEADHQGIWIHDYIEVPEARSFNDGLTNTQAMAKAGSKLAEKALDLGMYIASQDELEILYRYFKPGTVENYCYMRSGINLSAIEPTRPYTPESPAQTTVELFQAGGAESFEEAWYWSSTQHDSFLAWYQNFDYGSQLYSSTDDKLRARFLRRSVI